MIHFVLAGVDIGGTKCAVSLGLLLDQNVEIIAKARFPTPDTPSLTLATITSTLKQLLNAHPDYPLAAVGISCGGPLDSQQGLILSPPNLPTWDRIDVVTPLFEEVGVPVGLQHDANACALAEWKWGAGQGCRNLIFLTFGTGMGAGLILNNQLYSGTNDMAGEVGHVRLETNGPVGYGKAGSFEGFCSGGGIAQLAQAIALDHLQQGIHPGYCPTEADLPSVTAETVGLAARQGDILARFVFEKVAHYLGRGLALLVDILNPQKIIIGSIYARQRSLLEPLTLRVLQEEALSHSLSVCEIVPAGLGEQVGDYASLSVALNLLKQ